MSWRNLRAELCEVLAETVSARVPLGSFHPNQSVHVERGGRTTFRKQAERATCRECKRTFRRKKFGMKAVFCSKVCRERTWKRKHDSPLRQEIRNHRASTQRCPCGKSARAPKRNTGVMPRYCSAKCGEHLRNIQRPSKAPPGRFYVRFCACGKPAKRPNQTGTVPKHCSQLCAKRQSVHRQRCAQCIYRGGPACIRAVPKRRPWTDATECRPGRPTLSRAAREEARRMRADGALLTTIAARLGIGFSHASRLTKGALVDAKPWRGDRRRLTDAQREEARRMRAAGSLLSEIASRFGIDAGHASRIVKGAR
jgi:hypothetical protein